MSNLSIFLIGLVIGIVIGVVGLISFCLEIISAEDYTRETKDDWRGFD